MSNIAQQDHKTVYVEGHFGNFTEADKTAIRRAFIRGTINDLILTTTLADGEKISAKIVFCAEKKTPTHKLAVTILHGTTPKSIDCGAFVAEDYSDDIPSDEE